jgi:Skp family chaperone for outer membrane proteins
MVKKIMLGLGMVGLIVMSLFIYHTYFTTKVVYIDIPKVFNRFDMKKELQEKYKKVESGRGRILDSLKFDLQLLSKKLKEDQKNKELMYEFDIKREDFFKQKSQIEQDNVALSNQYDKQILEQMTQYIIDYGKRNKLDIIMGADGNGVLMYANEKYDRSEEIISFINNKYKGIE